jgi:hypothetical protein
MLKTSVTYTCSSCNVDAVRTVSVGLHPYSPESMPPNWSHVPSITGRADDQIFCDKPACVTAAGAARVKYAKDSDDSDAAAAAAYQKYVEDLKAAGGVDPLWAPDPADVGFLDVLYGYALSRGFFPAPASVEDERKKRFLIYDNVSDDDWTAMQAAKTREEIAAFDAVLRTALSTPVVADAPPPKKKGKKV